MEDILREDTEIISANKRGMEMMNIPIKDLPKIAQDFAQHLCKNVGMCMETLLTAWIVYAQCIEKLPCADDLYKARKEDIKWFNNYRKYNQRMHADASQKAVRRGLIASLYLNIN